jgi:hypothetical protein
MSILMMCRACGRKHKMTIQPCPECGGAGGHILMPESENVQNHCHGIYRCDGCEAYRQHQNPY